MEMAGLEPHPSKVRAAGHPWHQQLALQREACPWSLSILWVLRWLKAVGTQSQEEKLGKGSPETLSKSGDKLSRKQRQCWVLPGWV